MGFADILQGGVGGGMAGSGIAPGWGTAIGAGLGLLGGMFGGNPQDEMNNRLNRMNEEFQNRKAPQAGDAERAGLSSFRENQQGLVNRLEAMAAGQGPSLAQKQLQAATDRNVRQQQGLAAGARGPSAGAAQFQAMNNAGMLGAQAAQDAGQARIQEQFNAINQLGLTLHGARGADEEMGRFNAAQGNQFALANLDAQLRAMGMNDQMRMQILQAQSGMAGGPSMGERLLAGGSGLYEFGATQRAQNRLNGQQGQGGGGLGGIIDQGIARYQQQQNLHGQYGQGGDQYARKGGEVVSQYA